MLKIGVVGASGLVGQALCQVAQERNIQADWQFFASGKEPNRSLVFQGKVCPLEPVDPNRLASCDLIFMLTQGEVSAPLIEFLLRSSKARIIDNAATYRLDPNVPLIIPEINGHAYQGAQLIANPNCVTIQLLLALQPLKALPLTTVALTSFQSVSGSGLPGLLDLEKTSQQLSPEFYPHPIWDNVLPQCDLFEGDWTIEEKKILAESQKIAMPSYAIEPTCTRVPVRYGHQLSLTLFFEQELSKNDIASLWQQAPRVTYLPRGYALNSQLKGSDQVFVSRLRAQKPLSRVWQCWVGADNLRVGAATNALNIAAVIGLKEGQIEFI